MTGYIYMLTSPEGKRYIGQTLDFERRMRQYTFPSRADISPIYREIHKFGMENFKQEILETVEGDRDYVENKMNELERQYIEKYDTVKDGLNVRRWDSRNMTFTLSDETRERMRISHTGIKHSKESRQKRAGENAYQGKKVYSEKLGKTFPTLREAAHYAGISNGCKVSECIKGLRKSAGRHPETKEQIDDWKYV